MDGGVAVSKQYGINTISSADKKRNTHNPIGDRRKRLRGIKGRYSARNRFMTMYGERVIFLTAEISLPILTKSEKR